MIVKFVCELNDLLLFKWNDDIQKVKEFLIKILKHYKILNFIFFHENEYFSNTFSKVPAKNNTHIKKMISLKAKKTKLVALIFFFLKNSKLGVLDLIAQEIINNNISN